MTAMREHTNQRHRATLDLPPCCFARLPSTGEPVLIVRDESGFQPLASSFPVEQLNAMLARQPTPAEVEAMLAGSLFGWDVPGADPARYASPGAPPATAGRPAPAPSRPAPGIADWGGPDTPLRLGDNTTIWPRPTGLPDPIRDMSRGHLGFYGWLGLVDVRLAQVSPWTLEDFPERDWRDEYDGRVPPQEAADVAVDGRAAVRGIAPSG